MISSTKSDAFAVVGDRNMRNRTVQVYSFHNNSSNMAIEIQIAFFFYCSVKVCFAKRKGRLTEVQLTALMEGLWNEWRVEAEKADQVCF